MKKIYLFLTLAGVLFSGYLSGVKFFTKTCAFNETCPYFLGYPACYYGFAMFSLMFIFAVISLVKSSGEKNLSKKLMIVSLIGIIFSGYFVIQENFTFSTCAMGLVFYLTIFTLSTRNLFR
ncbi:MAG: vitamin K epoxide reductase family protein [Minisyncoccia bacterium]